MKTTKIISALSIAMIILGSSAFATKPSSDNTKARQLIRYQVSINISAKFVIPNVPMLVVVKDEKGTLVAPPQQFQAGSLTYTFTEKGTFYPVNATRVAMLVIPNTGGRSVKLSNNTIVKTGSFVPGQLYQFQIFPNNGDSN